MRYRLTRRAVADLRAIHKHSVIEWGQLRADRYLNDIYVTIMRLAASPERDLSRNRRAAPFHMIPAEKHFLIYEQVGEVVAILAVLHQRQDVEKAIAGLTEDARRAIADIKRSR